jgi:hypothetical protein
MEKHSWEVVSIGIECLAFFLAAPDFLAAPLVAEVQRQANNQLNSVIDRLPFARRVLPGPFLFLTVVFDVAVYASIRMGLWQYDSLLATAGQAVLMSLAAYFTVTAVLYGLQLILQRIVATSGKGKFFLTGAIAFTASKAIAICVALGYLGTAHAAVVHEAIPDVVRQIAPACFG